MRGKRHDKSRRPKNILILLWSSMISSGREFLGGFAKQARARRNWHLQVVFKKRFGLPMGQWRQQNFEREPR